MSTARFHLGAEVAVACAAGSLAATPAIDFFDSDDFVIAFEAGCERWRGFRASTLRL
jgi:hypothetical protein